MRNISFMLTKDQVVARTKDVTRRNGWANLKPGDVLRGVEKSQGLKKGEKIRPLCTIRVVSVRREKLRRMTDDLEYGRTECVREGFPPPHEESDPAVFVEFFCRSHKGVTPDSEITRIEYGYVDREAPAG